MKQDTIEQMILKHEGLVFYTMDMLNCKRTDEAISVGYEALWRACETFDESKGNAFSTYAVTCIKHAIWDMFRAQRPMLENEVFLEDLKKEVAYLDNVSNPKEDSLQTRIVRYAVDEALKKLPDKKLQIAKVWLESAMSATAIAAEVGCSQSYVSQVIPQVKKLIRQELLDAGYCPKFTGDSTDQ